MNFSEKEIQKETNRLYKILSKTGWSKLDCEIYAPLTLEIGHVKKKKDAVILAHSYQTPDIMYGIADYIGDSYGLSKIASEHKAKTIVFCGVYFMAETAKLLNPEKEVLVTTQAGCSLAESITGKDVRTLRKKHPKAGVVCYVNTTADVKAECDVCCTSANSLKIVESMPQKEIIFLPDEYMAKNLQKETKKKIIPWKGRCIVHEIFSPETIQHIRKTYPGVKILAHTECSPGVINEVDFAGGTSGMLEYVKKSKSDTFMIITECGITDRIKTEFPKKKIVGTCSVCPYMKEIRITDVLQVLNHPKKSQYVEIPEKVAVKARKSLKNMFDIS